jgi:hypothetical protein
MITTQNPQEIFETITSDDFLNVIESMEMYGVKLQIEHEGTKRCIKNPHNGCMYVFKDMVN